MLQLAMTQEFAGDEDEAEEVVRQGRRGLPRIAPGQEGRRGSNAARIGRQADPSCKGPSVAGQRVDLGEFRRQGGADPVLGHLVASRPRRTWPRSRSWSRSTGPTSTCIGVSLDDRKPDLAAYLKENPLPWPQIYEEGGLDSRLANEMGIITVPTMILVDKQGKVVRRAIEVAELDQELKKLLR